MPMSRKVAEAMVPRWRRRDMEHEAVTAMKTEFMQVRSRARVAGWRVWVCASRPTTLPRLAL
jgi:hypothetical protein